MIDEDDGRTILRTAVFGKQVEIFLDSDIGQYLLQCADSDIESVASAFAGADPLDSSAMVKLQVKIKVAMSVKAWLAEAVGSGLQAAEAVDLKEYT